jgi:DNA polymerase IV
MDTNRGYTEHVFDPSSPLNQATRAGSAARSPRVGRARYDPRQHPFGTVIEDPRERTAIPMAAPSEPILHVDLDAFYASVEVLKDPSLAGKPVVVGGSGGRGVVMSASYEARAHGLHSAMPSARAKRLCPDAVFVPPDFGSYVSYSKRFRDVLLSVTPLVEPISLDEAFLDVSGATRLFGDPSMIARTIRARVKDELGLVCSVGVGPTKFVAKLASTRAKPDGLIVVPADGVVDFLHPLPVGALWGVGERTADALSRLGIRTVRELTTTPTSILERALGENQAKALRDLANGIDPRRVVPHEAPKSVSHEETFARDLEDREEILRELLRLSHRVASRLRKDGYRARTISVKFRLPSFTTFTRARTLPDATDTAAEVFRVAAELYERLPAGRRRFRLLGVAATGLTGPAGDQPALLEEDRWSDAERALDRVAGRFGLGAAVPATLLPAPKRSEEEASKSSGERG